MPDTPAMPMPSASSVARAIAATRTDTADVTYECEYVHGTGRVASIRLTELQYQLAKVYEQEYQNGRQQTIGWLRSQLAYRAAAEPAAEPVEIPCPDFLRPWLDPAHDGHVSCTADGCVIR